MNKLTFVALATLLVILCGQSFAAENPNPPRRINIIFILADDFA